MISGNIKLLLRVTSIKMSITQVIVFSINSSDMEITFSRQILLDSEQIITFPQNSIICQNTQITTRLNSRRIAVKKLFQQNEAWTRWLVFCHYGDVIMGAIASQITSLTSVHSTRYSDADQRKHQSPASLAFVRGINRGPVNSPHKWPVTRKMFPFDDVIMHTALWNEFYWQKM